MRGNRKLISMVRRIQFPAWQRGLICIVLISAVLASVAGYAYASESNLGGPLYQQAQALETETRYGQAIALYNQALTLFLEEGDDESAYECGEAARKLSIIQLTYPWTLEQLKQLIRDAYPHATDEQIESWTSGENVQQTQYDGEAHYFSDAVANLKYRHMDLMHADEVVQQAYHDLVGNINSIAQTEPALPWAQYHNPATYRGTHTISIPREELPKTGTIRVWLPIPINNGPQTGVTVDSISPEKWLKLPPSIDQDIGLVYMEVPMEELTEDLFIEVSFVFTHYEQRFRQYGDQHGNP